MIVDPDETIRLRTTIQRMRARISKLTAQREDARNKMDESDASDARLADAVKFLRDLSCDGCEYGDDCPPFVPTNHYECGACKCKRMADRLEQA